MHEAGAGDATENLPAAQLVQLVAPEFENFPPEQPLQLNAVVAPDVVRNVPAGQLVQAEAPTSVVPTEKYPAPQLTQIDEAEAEA